MMGLKLIHGNKWASKLRQKFNKDKYNHEFHDFQACLLITFRFESVVCQMLAAILSQPGSVKEDFMYLHAYF